MFIMHAITIKASDKGGNIVLMDNEQCSRMCLNILSNRDRSWPVGSDIMEAFNKNVCRWGLSKWCHLETNLGLYSYPRVTTFYAHQKIHKNAVDPPGRPILSGNGAISWWAQLGDEHIRPFVLTIPSYIRDTIHLLQIIEGVQVLGQCILAIIDVEALYSSILQRACMHPQGAVPNQPPWSPL